MVAFLKKVLINVLLNVIPIIIKMNLNEKYIMNILKILSSVKNVILHVKTAAEKILMNALFVIIIMIGDI